MLEIGNSVLCCMQKFNKGLLPLMKDMIVNLASHFYLILNVNA